MFRFEWQRRQGVTRNAFAVTRDHIFDLAHQARLEAQAAGGHGRGGAGHLKHREAVVTLADAQRNRLTRVPALLFGGAESAPFPFGRGQQAGHLAIDVDAGLAPEAHRVELLVHQVDTEFVGE